MKKGQEPIDKLETANSLKKEIDELNNFLYECTTKITNIIFDGIDHKDAPDYTDAYIVSAYYEGRPMTIAEIDRLDPDFVYEKLIEFLY